MKRLRAAYHFIVEDGAVGIGVLITIAVCVLAVRGPSPHPGAAALLLFAGIVLTVVVSLLRATYWS